MNYLGYWNKILDENNNLFENYDSILEHIKENTSMCAMNFLHGFCTIYAYVLATQDERFQLCAINDDFGELLHAYCTFLDENNQTWFLDIRGATTDTKKFFEEFEVEVDITGEIDCNWYSIWVYCTPQDFDEYWDYFRLNLEEKEVIETAKIFRDKFLRDFYLKVY